MRLTLRLLAITALTLAGCAEPSPKPTGVTPTVLCNGIDTKVTVTGTDFRETPTVAFQAAGGQPIAVAPGDVTFVDEEHITFTARASLGLQVGTRYDLVVTNPAGGVGMLPMAFTIVPPPSLTSIAPAAVCDTMPGTITLTGTLFRTDPTHGPILVTIGTPTPTTLSEAGGAVAFVDPQTVKVNLPAGLPDGVWSVTIEDEDGCGSTLATALTVSAPPTVSAVTPMAAYNGKDTTLTITGTNFNAGTTVSITTAGGTPITLTPTVVDAQTITAVIPTGTPAGMYTITVSNGACSATIALTVTDLPPIMVGNVINPFGCNTQATPVTIDGVGFVSTPSAKLIGAGATTGDLALINTAFVSSTKLASVVPSGGKIGGPYDLDVTNPDGSHATKAMAFTITKLCPPVIDSVTPSSVPHDYNTGGAGGAPIIIAGANFRSDATVVLVDATGKEIMFPGAALTITATQITLNFNAATTNLPDGIYLVRVKEADDSVANGGTGALEFGDFSLFIVTNPSGKFQPAVMAKALPTNAARRGLAVVGGQNTAAARYLYAIGGDGGTATPATLADGWVAPLDVFGHVGDAGWLRLRKRATAPSTGETFNDLPSARTGVAAVQLNRWVYLVGGTTAVGTGAAPAPTANGPLKDVLRAHILSAADAPAVTNTTAAGGTLAAGTYYYKVSMLVAGGVSGYGPNAAETVASDEQVVTVTAGQKVQLSFTQPAGSSVPPASIAGYRIYRSPMPNQATESEQWLADVTTTATSSTFMDDGSVAVAATGAHPLPAGMLSEWEPAGTLLIPRAYASVELATPPGTSTTNLYVVGGHSGAGPEKTWEYVTVDATLGTLGTFGPTGLAPGGATNCTLETCLVAARWALFTDVITAPASVTASGTAWLLAGTGTSAGADPIDERAQILTTGLLGTWAAVPTGPGGAFTTPSNTLGAIGFYSNGYIAIADGYSGTTVSSKEEFGLEACTPTITGGACIAGSDFTQTGKSASTLMITPAVAFSGYTISSGYLFVVGGSTDGTNAVTNAEQAPQ